MANNSQPSSAQPHWPPSAGSMGPQSYGSPLSSQFRPVAPAQQGQHFVPAASQQFRPVGQVPSPNAGMPAVQNLQMQFSQPMQQYPPRPNQPGLSTPSQQPVQVPYGQTNRPLTSEPPQSHQSAPPLNSQMPGVGAPGMPPSSTYGFVPSSFGLPQNVSTPSQFQPISQVHASVAPVAMQPWLSSGNQSISLATPIQQTSQQPPLSSADVVANVPSLTLQSSDWQEHTSADGRRYYYNKKTRQSSWEKPLELMTPLERADASTVWKEFTTPEGRKYYYNKVTKQSKWTIPEELKLAREQAQAAASQGTPSGSGVPQAPVAAVVSATEMPSTAISLISNTLQDSSLVSVMPIVNSSPNSVSGPTAVPVSQSATTDAPGTVSVSPLPAVPPGGSTVSVPSVSAKTAVTRSLEPISTQDTDGASVQDIEEARKGMTTAGKVNVTPVEEKVLDDEPFVYANKLEAKNAFKFLLESANVQSDWTWEQAMREIINDKRYGALKTLGERKQAFNEYLGQRKKLEAEERRMRQKKAREEFTEMLEESKELTSSMRWSKAQSLFENDERFKAVERARDREDLFESYIVDLERKEREHAAEEKRRNIAEYRKFLESCDFIKSNSQWRKVQDRLEDDERCSRLEKIDRLLIFQDYIHDLEKEEEEKKKMQKEQLRRAERKNRDAFRKLMEDHVADGTLTARTYWRDYCLKVKDLPQYLAVASNTSGSTPKDLFEDVAEELEKQYHEDKTRIKDAMKSGKISMVYSWTFEDFKAAISEEVGSSLISDIKLKLVYDELLERAKEKEEKEAKKRQRLADDFTKLLHTYKEITTSSNWEDSKPLFEESQEYRFSPRFPAMLFVRSIAEESSRREIFEEYIAHLQEKAKDKERKRVEEKAKREKDKEDKEKRKEKERKEKEREREREKGKDRTKKDETDSENLDISDSYGHKEEKKKDREKDRKQHRKRHQSTADDGSSDKDDREESKKSRRHGSDRKKSRKHAHSPESESESRHKKHKRDRDGSRRNSGYEDLEDGEVGEDGEIQ
ncbi:pre-mRNA-processing protein 40A-like isoform X1 [Hibiscus syriacus]|uniref:pre-mRNA-processing protein 40A-like isoform X1 n=1 Tax=Hibiscus syriacus TaxID=106335 RepID=UPI00192199A9|nr:pre-mRNA-processing protein 40A-like isoform X1 [Hibiscus syriacus]